MGRFENIEVFNDTEKLCKTNKRLVESIKKSLKAQTVIKESYVFTDNDKTQKKKGTVKVSMKRSFEAAKDYAGKKVCVHNFASASNPGGGVTNGASAQEECLCRISTLYFNLNTSDMWEEFYYPHRQERNPLHNDDCIYTPNVTVFKTDTAVPQLMPESEWYDVNVITCAAPNLRNYPGNVVNVGAGTGPAVMKANDLLKLHEKRMNRIFDIARQNEDEVLILGAFGCGAFLNSPEVVATAMRNVVKERKEEFDTIEFAVYCSDRETANYKVFKRLLGNL